MLKTILPMSVHYVKHQLSTNVQFAITKFAIFVASKIPIPLMKCTEYMQRMILDVLLMDSNAQVVEKSLDLQVRYNPTWNHMIFQ